MAENRIQEPLIPRDVEDEGRFEPHPEINEMFQVDRRQVQNGHYRGQRKCMRIYMIACVFFIYLEGCTLVHFFKDANMEVSPTSCIMAFFTRQSLLGFIFILMCMFYLLAAIQAHRDPSVLLDHDYQQNLHSILVKFVILFYVSILVVFLNPLVQEYYENLGYKKYIKQLITKPEYKKEMQQYHLDQVTREHLLKETETMKLNNTIDFYLAWFVVLVALMYFYKKAKAFIKKRKEIQIVNRRVKDWHKIKSEDNEAGITEETCRICLDEFVDSDKVIQLKCNVNHVYHHICFERYIEAQVNQGNLEQKCLYCQQPVQY